jgi:hypothetical protein
MAIFQKLGKYLTKSQDQRSGSSNKIKTLQNSLSNLTTPTYEQAQLLMILQRTPETSSTGSKHKYQKEIDKRTTEKGKAAQQKALTDLLNFFSPTNKAGLKKIFDLQKLIILAKLKLINILDRCNKISTFLKHTKNGYITTGSEGFVAIDTLGGDAVKIVDRMEFSYANFSPEILKGWQTPRRS